jgi:hypothetical protein
MTVKRKLSVEPEDSVPSYRSKHLKLVPFPNYEADMDVAMSEVEPIAIPSFNHVRHPSDASSLSSLSDTSDDSPAYPSFDLYPLPFFDRHGAVNSNSHVYALYTAQSTLRPDGSWNHSASSTPENEMNDSIGIPQPTNGFAHCR